MKEEPTFDRFLESVRGTNPFRSHRVTDPEGGDATVASIHKAAFGKLVRVVSGAVTEPTAVGVLLVGAPGVGKSHLLARLFQWAREDGATVVYLHNILASPDRMLRYVLSATVSDLVGNRAGGYATSRLYAVVNRALLKTGFRQKPRDIEARRKALTQLGRQVDPRGAVITVLNAFLAGTSEGSLGDATAERRAYAAVLWLSGEAIGAEDASLLGLPAGVPAGDDGLALPDDAAVEHVLHVLARLCALAERPLVLCLDQIDNLDREAAHALTSYAHALLDRSKHLVVILSGVKQSLLTMRGDEVIAAAAWDRIAEHLLELNLISPAEARAILEGRLDAALSAFEENKVQEVIAARRRDRLFPLGTTWLDKRLADLPELRPRDVILWARDRWETQRERLTAAGGERWLKEWPGPENGGSNGGGPTLEEAIDAEVKKKLLEGVMRRRLQQASLPPDEDNLASLAHHLLARCTGQDGYTLTAIERVVAKKRGPAPTYDLLATETRADGVAVTTGVTFLCATSGRGAWKPLQRMAEDAKPPDHRILVTDEERRPLILGGAGQSAYDDLCKLGRRRFLHLRLDFAGHAELDSLVSVLGAAKSQDLEIEHPRGKYQRVTDDEVLASFHRQNLLLGHPVLRELLTEDIVDGPESVASRAPWDPKRTQELIMAELSWRMGLMGKELAQIFVAREKLPQERFQEAWLHIKSSAQALHDEQHIHATAQDDDLFVQLRSKK